MRSDSDAVYDVAVRVDLNSDVGESFGPWRMGHDDELIPLVTSVNVACGAHAGDPLTMEQTVRIAAQNGAAVGAHPGYPDLVGFGRRELAMTADELTASLIYQIGAVAAFCATEGVDLHHVKPHGALYNRSACDASLAEVVARAVRRFSRELILVGLSGSVSLDAAAAEGLAVASEAFADRAYESDGSLRPRRLPGAVLRDPETAAAQALAIVRDGAVTASDGSRLPVRADTLCIHGDTPGAAAYASAVRRALVEAGVSIEPVRAPAA